MTTVISQGELHIAGRPKDTKGLKSLAILARRFYQNYKPYGLKILAGSILLDDELSDQDFKELYDDGIRIVAEVGVTGIREELLSMIKTAKKYGMIVTMHIGGKSVPCSQTVMVEDVMRLQPDGLSHINGGPISPPQNDLKSMINNTKAGVELVYGGNLKAAIDVVNYMNDRHDLNRVILGCDAPTSSAGLGTLGILRMVALLSSVAGIHAERALAFAAGNTARVFGLSCGSVSKGKDADLVIFDSPEGSAGEIGLATLEEGNIPAIAMVIVDGKIRCHPSRLTVPARRILKVNDVTTQPLSFEE